MSMNEQQSKFLLDYCLLIQFATRKGFMITGGEMLRPDEMQEIYYADGSSTVRHSNHQDKLAADLNFFQNGKYVNGFASDVAKRILQEIGDFWESLSEYNSWGGNWETFIDTPHFERNS